MTWLHLVVMGASGLAAMRAALERGDVDEAARQGALAGPAVIERGLAAADRPTRLAAIAAAPIVEDRAELLGALATLAGGADRRTAIPAARAARTIARELARKRRLGDATAGHPDDLADDDVATWRAAWAELALRGDRWIELRLVALDTAAALDPDGAGVALDAALHDPDPAFRRAVATIVALPAPPTSLAALADAVIHDADPDVALGAAQSLCLSIDPGPGPGPAPATPRPVLDALGAAGLARIRALIGRDHPDPATLAMLRDAARCLTADGAPDNVAAARALPAAPAASVIRAAPPAPAADPAAPATPSKHGRSPRTHRGAAR